MFRLTIPKLRVSNKVFSGRFGAASTPPLSVFFRVPSRGVNLQIVHEATAWNCVSLNGLRDVAEKDAAKASTDPPGTGRRIPISHGFCVGPIFIGNYMKCSPEGNIGGSSVPSSARRVCLFTQEPLSARLSVSRNDKLMNCRRLTKKKLFRRIVCVFPHNLKLPKFENFILR